MYGVLYRITEKQLEELDRTKDVPRDYERVAFEVHRLAISKLNQDLAGTLAWVYVGNPHRFTAEINPDPQYVQLLIQAIVFTSNTVQYIIFFRLQQKCEFSSKSQKVLITQKKLIH